MKIYFILTIILFSVSSFAASEEAGDLCISQIEKFDEIAGRRGADKVSAEAAKDAFMSCLETLAPADIFVATSLRSRCLRNFESELDPEAASALAENCALDGMKYLKDNS